MKCLFKIVGANEMSNSSSVIHSKTTSHHDSITIIRGKFSVSVSAYHGECSGVKLSIKYTPDTQMSLKVIESLSIRHDGSIGEPLTDMNCTLIGDRVYFQIQRIDWFLQRNSLLSFP